MYIYLMQNEERKQIFQCAFVTDRFEMANSLI